MLRGGKCAMLLVLVLATAVDYSIAKKGRSIQLVSINEGAKLLPKAQSAAKSNQPLWSSSTAAMECATRSGHLLFAAPYAYTITTAAIDISSTVPERNPVSQNQTGTTLRCSIPQLCLIKSLAASGAFSITGSPGKAATTVQLVSLDIKKATGWQVMANTFPVQPVVTLLGDTLTVQIPPYKVEEGAEGPFVLTTQLLVQDFPLIRKSCCDSNLQVQAAGIVCRQSKGPCMESASCDGISGDCPASTKLPNGAKCPWFPKEHPEITRAASNALRTVLPSYMDDERALPTFADAAGNWQQADALTVEDDAEHIPCEGHCYDGVCAPKSLPCRPAAVASSAAPAAPPTRTAQSDRQTRTRGMRSA